jgi:aminoglycoside phosphotransferase (APT) family kinase protein
VDRALPGCRALAAHPLSGGLRNANFQLRFDSRDDPLLLRIYRHDASLCQKEIDLLRMLRGSVPVAEVIYAEPRGLEEIPPFAVLGYIEGIDLRALRRTGEREAMAQAAGSAGEVLAAIGRSHFPIGGWLGPGPGVTAPLLAGADPMPRFVDLCLASANLARWVPAEWRERLHALAWSQASAFAELEQEPRLVHGDFSAANLVVRENWGRWQVAAVLDWEFAVSSTPLADLGNFLRYERAARPLMEPHFSQGYVRGGGQLAGDWRRLARSIDLLAICESLTHPGLPAPAAAELLELARATVENRDPLLA